ncbi:MAG: diguanylate cyclase [Firmicutes bacterium]|nr:diguanylate cyclase [Bacillota bacterium]
MSSNISKLKERMFYSMETFTAIIMQPVYNDLQHIVDFELIDWIGCLNAIGGEQVAQNRYLSKVFPLYDADFWRSLLVFANNSFSTEVELAVKLQGKKYNVSVKRYKQTYITRFFTDAKNSASQLYVKESRGKTSPSYRDKVTGLYNYSYFQEILPQIMEKQKQSLGLVLLSVNGLEIIHNLLGKEYGEKYLKSAADLLLSAVGKKEIVLRMAGDELAVILPAASCEEVKKFVQKFKDCCKRTKGYFKTCLLIEAAFAKTYEHNLNELYTIARYKLRQNKQINRNRIRVDLLKSIRNMLASEHKGVSRHWGRLETLLFKLGKLMDLTAKQLEDLKIMAILHDVGFLKVPKGVVQKSKILTMQEWQEIKKHCESGWRIICTVPELASVAEAVLCHHERWDGFGYPRGLKGKEIPLLSRVFAVVDAFDAMTQYRVYRQKVSPLEALDELERCSGQQFDPEIVHLFCQMMRREELNKKLEREREKLREIAATKGVNSKEALEQSKLIDEIHNEFNKFKF